jgi:hypothetical protein
VEGIDAGPRLIIVCGLPGAGKTTLAGALERRLRAVRVCPDEWMDALSIDTYDEERRAKIEALQWQVGQQLLALGLAMIIEWRTWGRSERDALRIGARALGAAVELHYLSAPATIATTPSGLPVRGRPSRMEAKPKASRIPRRPRPELVATTQPVDERDGPRGIAGTSRGAVASVCWTDSDGLGSFPVNFP